ncbi:MAG: hypothetical protein EOP04_01785 [Proteobacteria bacterium]|nr:MAG: hypothetical protein EOP04_01785 [Pseudomonadota bacterium]
MKLPIEIWISERYQSGNINELFQEAVICYRNGAYRSSLLLSYLGFLTIIKETIQKSKPAADFAEGEWQEQQRKVSNHESWEQEVTNALFSGAKTGSKKIFLLNDDLRAQVQYWRSRRNDAAHNKDNKIIASHTEAFWVFLQSNIPKMVVNGGKDGLLLKFYEHFDDELTPPGSDFRHLVQEIPAAILESELPTFFHELPKYIDGRKYYLKNDTSKVFDEVFNLPDAKVVTALAAYLKQDDRDIKFLTAYPNRIPLMHYSAAELRALWKTRLLRADQVNPFIIYAELLRLGAIPPSELDAAHKSMFNRFHQVDFNKLPESDQDIATLLSNGYYEVIYKDAIEERELKRFLWVNDKCDMLISMVRHRPLDAKTVTTICTMVNSSNPSNWLIRELKELFADEPRVKHQFEALAAGAGIAMPEKLK